MMQRQERMTAIHANNISSSLRLSKIPVINTVTIPCSVTITATNPKHRLMNNTWRQLVGFVLTPQIQYQMKHPKVLTIQLLASPRYLGGKVAIFL